MRKLQVHLFQRLFACAGCGGRHKPATSSVGEGQLGMLDPKSDLWKSFFLAPGSSDRARFDRLYRRAESEAGIIGAGTVP